MRFFAALIVLSSLFFASQSEAREVYSWHSKGGKVSISCHVRTRGGVVGVRTGAFRGSILAMKGGFEDVALLYRAKEEHFSVLGSARAESAVRSAGARPTPLRLESHGIICQLDSPLVTDAHCSGLSCDFKLMGMHIFATITISNRITQAQQ